MRPAQHGGRRPAPAPRYGPTVPPGVVLVTGGSRGIGAATARAAAAAGGSVALTFRDDEAAAAAVVTGIEANGGIVGRRARVDELTADRVQRMLAVNVLGTVLCCREAVRRMSTRYGGPGGSVVLVSSAASRLG